METTLNTLIHHQYFKSKNSRCFSEVGPVVFPHPGSQSSGLLLRVVAVWRPLLVSAGIELMNRFCLSAAIGSPFKPVENYHYSGET